MALAGCLAAACSSGDADAAVVAGSDQSAAEQAAEEVVRKIKAKQEVIWTGTIGNLPITMCFRKGVPGDGVYYYASQLKPISLKKIDPAGPLELTEMVGWSDESTGRWIIKEAHDDAITGEWRGGGKSLPLRLTPTPVFVDKYDNACNSAEFAEPRMAGGKVAETREQWERVSYTGLAYVPGRGFNPDSVDIKSFVLTPDKAGDAKINTALRKVIPNGKVSHDFADCMAFSVASSGRDGSYYHYAQPELITANWLGLVHGQSVYCGRAHPSHWQHRQVFDRESGAEVDSASWLTTEALVRDPEVVSAPRVYVRALAPQLYTLVEGSWPEGAEECLGDPSLFFSWDIGLVREGLVFKPNVAHVMTPCAESITLTWDALEPFLNDEGRAVRDSL